MNHDMKYKIGDKVRYDGGDWWLYGTVSAVFEHSICPCYRLSVERMEKKNCKFSITQFEFELEAYDEVDSDKDIRKWEKSEIEDLKKYYGTLNHEDLSKVLKRSPQAIEQKWLQIKPEPEPEIKPSTKPESKAESKAKSEPELKPEPEVEQKKTIRTRKTSDAWEKNLEEYTKGTKSNVLNAWKAKNRKDFKIGILSNEKIEKLKGINFSFDIHKKKRKGKDELAQNQEKEPSKRKRGEAWDENLEAYRKGEKSNLISTWIANNRKQYNEGKLSTQKFEKLIEINFPFDVVKKKDDSWDKQLEMWKNGDRKSIPMQQWRQRSIRQFDEGKLSGDKIVKLREVGILK